MQYDYPSYSGFRCVACNIGFNNFDDQKKHYFAYHSRNITSPPTVIETFKPKTKANANKPAVIEIKCDVCNLSCSSKITYDFHVKGKKHAKAIGKMALIAKGNQNTAVNTNNTTNIAVNGGQIKTEILPTADVICRDCSVNCSTMDQLKLHCTGLKHQKVLRMKQYTELMGQKDPSVYCGTCDLYLLPELMLIHLEGGKHKRKCNNNRTNEPATKKRKTNETATTIEYCGFCKVAFKRSEEAVAHYQSRVHMGGILNNNKFPCEICQVFMANQDMLDLHLKGFKHYVKVNRGNASPEGDMSAKLLKMREKLKSLKTLKAKKTSTEEDSKTVSLPLETPCGDDVKDPAIVECAVVLPVDLVGDTNSVTAAATVA